MQFGAFRYITKVLGMTPLNFKDETIADMFVLSLFEFTGGRHSPLL
jgi:hypothetical protein